MEKSKNKKNNVLKIISACIVGFINGFFGAGGGLLCVPTLEHIYKLETKKAHATTIAVILPISIISSVIYILKNTVNVFSVISVTSGVILGGFVGAIVLKRASGAFLRWLFIAILFTAGVRMVV